MIIFMNDDLFLNKDFINSMNKYLPKEEMEQGERKAFCLPVSFSKEDFYIREHILDSKRLIPAVIFIELLSEIAATILEAGCVTILKDIVFIKPLFITEDKLEIYCTCTYNTSFIKATVETSHDIHLQGNLLISNKILPNDKIFKLEQLPRKKIHNIEKEIFYKQFEKIGFTYGATFKAVHSMWLGDDDALALLKGEDLKSYEKDFLLHPGILEGGLQAAGYFLNKEVKENISFVPFQMGQMTIYQPLTLECFVYIRQYETNNKKIKKAELFFLNKNGQLLIHITDYIVMPFKKKPIPIEDSSAKKDEPVDMAIIGMSGRMPQSDNLSIFWQNLIDEKDMITHIPHERFPWKDFFGDPLREPNKTNSIWGGFLNDIKGFDAKFFKLSKEEADHMDPQQRLFLEVVWELFENAGYKPSEYFGSNTGVYVGVSNQEYLESMQNRVEDALIMLGNNHPMIANRISYRFNFKGPSEPVDTLCSSSLTALHRALNDIKCGICEQAIVGGVNIILTPRLFISYANARMLSSEGRCKTFDKTADGFVRGEGVGAILIKPLHKALRDKDTIYAVIKGAAVGHQGRSHNIVAPNVQSQADIIVKAVKQSGIAPNTLTFIETHGTGTSVGDAVEINGLKAAFEEINKDSNITTITGNCYLGAIKSNIGHLESAAGIAGIFKVILAMKQKKIPANLHFETLNPQINLTGSNFSIVGTTREWKRIKDFKGTYIPRRAGISSFGAGGVNAHVILEEGTSGFEAVEAQSSMIFVLSAANVSTLKKYAKMVLKYLEESREPFENIIYTAQAGREAMQVRIACIIQSKLQLQQNLRAYLNGDTTSILENTCQMDIWKKNSNKKNITDLAITRNYKLIMELYLGGDEIDWSGLYCKKCYSRTEFPQYPFEREKYWFDNKYLETPLFCQQEWIPEKISERCEHLPKNIIFICDSPHQAEHFLKESNKEILVYVVIISSNISLSGENIFYISSVEEEAYKKVWGAFLKKAIVPECIVYGIGLSEVNQESNFGHMFYLMKSCMQSYYTKNIRFLYPYLIRGTIQDVYHSAMAGFMKSVLLENKNFNGMLLQLENSEKVVHKILWELKVQWANTFQEVTYDLNNERKVSRLREKKEGINTKKKEKPIKAEGVYLISGGLGGIGKILAEYLIREYGARVVVFGRTRVADLSPDEQVSINKYEDALWYRQADVTKSEEMEELIRGVKDKYQQINGVFHLAGVCKDKQIIRKELEEAGNVLKTKIDGVINLDFYTKGESLDFFVVFSSITGIFGKEGQSDYAYANNFLDSFVEFRNAQTLKRTRNGYSASINWPFWENGGMKIPDEIYFKLKEKTGLDSLTSEVALDILNKIITYQESRAIVLSGDRNKLRKHFLMEGINED